MKKKVHQKNFQNPFLECPGIWKISPFIVKKSPIYHSSLLQKNFFYRILWHINILSVIKLSLFSDLLSLSTLFICSNKYFEIVNAPLNPYLFYFQAEDRQQNLTYFMRADGTREGNCLLQLIKQPFLRIPNFNFPQFKVLQSVFNFSFYL